MFVTPPGSDTERAEHGGAYAGAGPGHDLDKRVPTVAVFDIVTGGRVETIILDPDGGCAGAGVAGGDAAEPTPSGVVSRAGLGYDTGARPCLLSGMSTVTVPHCAAEASGTGARGNGRDYQAVLLLADTKGTLWSWPWPTGPAPLRIVGDST